ncbi:MAG TPA: hypothetical protein VFT50_05415 [Baekduia sp.]|nr:hypothetical protein [Baekduia sp.]
MLAPWGRPWELLGLPQPHPAAIAIAAGIALAASGVLLLRAASPRAVAAAATADAAGALAVAAWWLVAHPGHGTRGTIVLAAIVASLVIQAVFDLMMLREPPAGERPGAA